MTVGIKRFIAILLAAALLALPLAGCGDKNMDADTGAVTGTADSAGTDTEASTDSDTESGADDGGDTQSSVRAPTYDYSEGIGDDGYFDGVRALDYVTLPEYKGIEIPAEDHEVTEEELDREISSLLSSYPQTRHTTDRAVEEGDSVNIDYVGSVDGVEFAGGNTNGQGTNVTAGASNYIDGFLTQIIGHMPGETFDVNVTFPDPYENDPDLSGKDAVFKTTINYISEQYTPELTDEFVAENLKEEYGWESADEVTEYYSTMIRNSKLRTYIEGYLVDNAEVSEIPQQLIESQKNAMLNYYSGLASQYGMTLEDVLPSIGMESVDDLVEQQRDALESGARSALIIQAVAEKEGLVLSENDVEQYVMESSPGLSADMLGQIKQYYGLGYIAREALADTVCKLVADSAVLQ